MKEDVQATWTSGLCIFGYWDTDLKNGRWTHLFDPKDQCWVEMPKTPADMPMDRMEPLGIPVLLEARRAWAMEDLVATAPQLEQALWGDPEPQAVAAPESEGDALLAFFKGK